MGESGICRQFGLKPNYSEMGRRCGIGCHIITGFGRTVATSTTSVAAGRRISNTSNPATRRKYPALFRDFANYAGYRNDFVGDAGSVTSNQMLLGIIRFMQTVKWKVEMCRSSIRKRRSKYGH